jgi:cobalamin synthase
MRSSDVFFSFVLAAALLLPCMMVFPKQIPHLLLAMGLCAFFSPLWHAFWRSQIGGLSGDVLGGAVELRQLLVFAVLALPL